MPPTPEFFRAPQSVIDAARPDPTGRAGSVVDAGAGFDENAIQAADRIAQRYAMEALEHLARIVHGSESDTVRIAAIREILNRGLGRASMRKRVFDAEDIPIPVLKIVPFANGSSD